MPDRLDDRHSRFFLGAAFPAEMPRTVLAAIRAPGGEVNVGAGLTFSAGDPDIGERVLLGQRPVLFLAHNTSASPQTVYVQSTPDPYERLGDVADDPLAAGEIRMFGPYTPLAWQQPDGYLYVDVSDPAVLLVAIEL